MPQAPSVRSVASPHTASTPDASRKGCRHAFLRVALPLTLSFAAIAPAAPAHAAVDHSPVWLNTTTLSYGLEDLDNFALPAGAEEVRFGNVMSRLPAPPPPAVFPFTKRTLGPYSGANPDLFFMAPVDNQLQLLLFENASPIPSDAQWVEPEEFGGIDPLFPGSPGSVATSNVWSGMLLLRYLHFRNELLDEIPEPRQPLGANTRKLVVLIHGWNPNSSPDSYEGDEFTALRNGIESRLNGTDWSLLLYHWEPDADTGRVYEGTEAPIKAAHFAHMHGQHLGELLRDTCPKLESIHLIAHSAGSWAARAAARHLKHYKHDLTVQATLLDPFMPAQHNFATVSSPLGKSVMDSLDDTLSSHGPLWRLENFFSEDVTGSPTEQVFDWPASFVNLRVDWVSDGVDVYDDHDGPILYYADTVYGAEGLPHANIGLPAGMDRLANRRGAGNVVELGWYRSLFRNEAIFADGGQPQSVLINVGSPVTLETTARSRRLEVDPLINYKWEVSKDIGATWSTVSINDGFTGADTRMLHATTATSQMTGWRFRVRIDTGAGGSTSQEAILTVATTPVIIIHPLANVTAAEGNGFSLEATAGGPAPLSYRWQFSTDLGHTWSSIYDAGIHTGADTPTLSVSAVNIEMDGWLYRVVVTNNDGSVASEPSKLTVPIPHPYTRWQWAGLNGNEIHFTNAKISTDGHVWVAGHRINPGSHSGYGGAVWKLDAVTGELLWTSPGDPQGSPGIFWRHIGVDAQGDVLVTGVATVPVEGGATYVLCAAKYSGTTHEELWRVYTPQDDGYMNYGGFGAEGAVDPAGNVVMVATSIINGSDIKGYAIKFDGATGSVVWKNVFDNTSGSGVAITPTGDVIFAHGPVHSEPGIFIKKLSGGSGDVVWNFSYKGPSDNGAGFGGRVTVDSAGDVIIAGDVNVAQLPEDLQRPFTAKLSGSSGGLIWLAVQNPPGIQHTHSSLAVVDSNGDVFAIYGANLSYDPVRIAMVTLKYSGSSGALLWSRQETRLGWYNRLNGVGVDSTGDVVVTGMVDILNGSNFPTAAFFAKYRGDTGALVWKKSFSSPWNTWNPYDQGQTVYMTAEDEPLILGIANHAPALWRFTEEPLPDILFDAPSVEINEGSEAVITGVLSAAWNNGNPLSPQLNADIGWPRVDASGTDFIWSNWFNDGPIERDVKITVNDNWNAPRDFMFHVKVNNVAPSIDAGPDEMLPVGANQFFRTSHITDPGSTDVLSGTINFGDGTGTQTLPVNNANRTYDSGHIFPGPGSYTVNVTVTDDDGGSASDSFVVTVQAIAPQITQQPEAITRNVGQSTTFNVGVSGTGPFQYQWRKDAVDIPGATGASYTIDNVQLSHAGGYSVYVQGPGGNIGSVAAQLTVQAPPTFTTHPGSQTKIVGQPVTFFVVVTGTPTPTLQWKFNGVDIPGATGPTYTINNVLPQNAGLYSVVASNVVTDTPSNSASLTVLIPPAFTFIPSDVTHNAGTAINWSAGVTGNPVPSLQWRRNGVDIPGATGTSFSIASVSPADAGTYTIFAFSDAGSLVSGSWTLTVNTPPVFTTHPASQAINPGSPVTFTAAATGNPAPTFQWKFNGVDIPGATGPSYTINSILPQNAGNYSVAATNSVGSVTSNAATLTLNSAPVFTAHPANLTRNVGQSAAFNATATGTPNPTFQWKKDGANIPGATNSSFFIPAVFPGNAGNYTVVATNSAGSVTSNAATLTVNIAPSFSSHPASQTRTVGQSVTFSASAFGSPAPTYQWRKDGVAIPGATADSYTIASVTLASAGHYELVATNVAGSAASNTAVLTINPAAVAPTFTLHPSSANRIGGQPVVLTAIATGDPAPTYQWRRNGVNIAGATGSSYSIATTNAEHAGSYTVVATNSAGSTTSNAAVLTISTVGAAAVGHGIGDLPGGAVFSQVRDATKVGGVIYAVGSSSQNGATLGDTAILWSSTGGMVALPNLVNNTTGQSFITASAITPDAAFIASRARNAATGNSRTAVRVARDGLANLDINNGAIPGLSAAVAISADGSVLYGLADNLNRAARFTAAGPTATLLPFPKPEHDRSAPAGRGTSVDGSVMVGTASTFAITGGQSVGPGNSAFRYVHGSGVSEIPRPAGGTWSAGLAVSPDGNLALVAGDSTAAQNGELYIHNATAGTITQLGSPAPGWRPGNFGGMSSDGAVAVVSYGDPNGSQRASFLRNSHGWHDIRTIIAAKGIPVDGWQADNVLGISPDGTLVFGSGAHESIEGFVVEFAPGDLAAYEGEPAATTISGVWSIGDTDGSESAVVVFNDDGTYFLIVDDSGGAGSSVDSEGRPMAAAVSDDSFGYETGTYTWDPQTGAFTVTTLVDALGDAGLAGLNNTAGMTINILGGTLTLHVPGPDGGSYTLANATDDSPITGAWIVGDPASEDTLTVVVFLADGTYFILSDGPDDDPSGQDGIEHGTYTWDPVTGAFDTTVLFDSNGDWGLEPSDGPVTVVVAGGTLSVDGQVVAVSASIPAAIAPVLNDHPEGRSVMTGQAVSFTVEAVGTAPFTYQWFKNGAPINGATAATYSITSAQAADAAVYSVIVTNPAGSGTSNGAALAVNAPPAISAQPVAKAVVTGATVTLEIAATGSGPIIYQWRRNGVPIAGANQPALTLSSVTAANAGSYSVSITNAYGTIASSAAALTVGNDSRLTNISTRAFAGSGDATLIVGFYIAGTGSKTLIIRGVGPRLGDYIPGPVVADPRITVYDSNQNFVDTNDDWDPSLAPDFVVVGAFSLVDGSKDAAMKITLPPGSYTVHLGNSGPVAESLVEVYDRSKDAGTRLVNLSCRMKIVTGQNVIVGTYLDGGPANVVVRNVGPGIAPYLSEPDRPFVLPDPMLRFYDGADALIGENDDWDIASRAFFGPVGAFDLPDGSKDAAARLSLAPGLYSIHATGNTVGGTLLVEFYQEP